MLTPVFSQNEMTREDRHWRPWVALLRERESASSSLGLHNHQCVSWLRSMVQFSTFHSECLPVTYRLLWNEHTCFGLFFFKKYRYKGSEKIWTFSDSLAPLSLLPGVRAADRAACRIGSVHLAYPYEKDRCQAITTLSFIPYPIFDKMLMHMIILLFSHILMTV